MKHYHELFLRVILLLATVLFGVGLFAASNYPVQYQPAAAAVSLEERDYRISLPSSPDLWRDPLSLDETLQMVGGWGCRMRAGTPYSILHWTSCF